MSSKSSKLKKQDKQETKAKLSSLSIKGKVGLVQYTIKI
jgi:hypothetical protein